MKFNVLNRFKKYLKCKLREFLLRFQSERERVYKKACLQYRIEIIDLKNELEIKKRELSAANEVINGQNGWWERYEKEYCKLQRKYIVIKTLYEKGFNT